MRQPLTVSTLGDHIDGEYGVTAHCEAVHGGVPCNNGQELDLEALAAKLGRDFKVTHHTMVRRLRCSRCGSKKVSIRMHPPTGVPMLN